MRIDHPEDFLNLVAHLPETRFTFQQGCFTRVEFTDGLTMLLVHRP
jgi:hypothetical protein